MDGILNILKPPGMTSHDVVDFIRRLLGGIKTGHTGTLDPGAAGVLPVCLGRATRVIQFLPNDKEYRVEIIFGLATSTGDTFGEVISRNSASSLTSEALEEVLRAFVGEIAQVPPMTSAVRYRGKRLYELARQGIEVHREPRQVSIYSLRLVQLYGTGTPHPRALVDVACSAGTYIRTLCADIGHLLGCGASMSFLLRTRAGIFSLEEALTLEEVEELFREGRLSGELVRLEQALEHFPAIHVRPGAVNSIKSGSPLYWPGVATAPEFLQEGQLVRLCTDRAVLAVARTVADSKRPGYYQFKPVRILA
ncbi:tRNA pseudouridine(55) synthase TruB [Desulfofundulus thermocisternus]|uniref:tRNA pseudouridine(55) synthase TruB n=1 Tax=Desulfofundulus thermocisternus TaxID=42471 RepID=UPI001A0BF4A2|nr:tRNA pseudouridine(55) synthase TruB [Desulfofundulus thermocisternus]MBE3585625.1 tRNA pseudouridine(55) synthase TruB [Thermoanaerobacter sp.]MCS5696103.1 tRNA pseudouridine(55) synthase TruB [Desulfofundulus thermocisternus]